MKKKFEAAAILLSLVTVGHAQGLAIDDSSSALNDRFANDGSFIMNNYDLSGVGRSSNNRWGTLVSRNVFVSATHFFPNTSQTLTFYKTNDPTGPSVTINIASGQQIGSSDVWVGVLSEPVPVGYAVYSFATADINNPTDFDASIYHEQDAFMLGQSPFNNFSGTQDVAVGRNVLDSWLDNASGTNDAIRAAIEDESNDVTYESTLIGGDSGAPLFVDFDEADANYDLQLVGTNWFVQPVSGPKEQNGFTYLGNYDAAIQTIIDSNPVPEPSGLALFGIGALLLASHRRRSA